MGISRRAFLKGTAVSAVGLATMNLFGMAAAEAADPAEIFVADETMEADVVVAGAGISGLSAAIEMGMSGLKVILLEKEGFVGGTLVGTEGMYGGGSKYQQEQSGTPPKKHEVVTSELEFTAYRSNPLLWGDMFDAAGGNVDWLMEKVGVTFERCDNYLGQSKYPTFCWWPGENGGSVIPLFMAKLEELGVTVMIGHYGVSLITDQGKVTGINVKETNGEKKIAIAAKAVVLATGGLANDLAYFGEKTGKDVSNYTSLFPIHETGDGMRMATAIGAKETPISQQNVFGVRGFMDQDPIMIATMQPALFVNENGERFMAEDLCYHKFFALATNALETQKKVFNVMDSAYVSKMENEGCLIGVARTKAGDLLTGLRDQLESAAKEENPIAFRGETIEELAADMGVDAETFTAHVAKYNEFCANGADTDFGKSAEFLAPIQEGPFYAFNPNIMLFATMGGIDVNRKMEVLDKQGNAIEGLYSTGLASCNLYMETYNFAVSGGSNAYCCFSGRKAAQSIIAKIQNA